MNSNSRALLAAILWGGFVAGTIDIGAACLISGRSAAILHVISGGLIGPDGRRGRRHRRARDGAAVDDVADHRGGLRACQPRLPMLPRKWVPWGVAYGVPVYFVMSYVVMPLSAWHVVPPFNLAKVLPNIAAMLLFGLIMAFFAARRAGVATGRARAASPAT